MSDPLDSYVPRDETPKMGKAFSIGDRNTTSGNYGDWSNLGNLLSVTNPSMYYGNQMFNNPAYDPYGTEITEGNLSDAAKDYSNFIRNKTYDEKQVASETDESKVAGGLSKLGSIGLSSGNPYGIAAGAALTIGSLMASASAEKKAEKKIKEMQARDKVGMDTLDIFSKRVKDDYNNQYTSYAPTFKYGGFRRHKLGAGGFGSLVQFHGPKHKPEGAPGASGIPLGSEAEVEGGEVEGTYGDTMGYIFSKRLGAAKEALAVENKYKLRPEDNVELNTKNIFLKAIMAKAEAKKLKMGVNSDGNPADTMQQGMNPMEQGMEGQPSPEEMAMMQQGQGQGMPMGIPQGMEQGMGQGMGQMAYGGYRNRFTMGGPDNPPGGRKEYVVPAKYEMSLSRSKQESPIWNNYQPSGRGGGININKYYKGYLAEKYPGVDLDVAHEIDRNVPIDLGGHRTDRNASRDQIQMSATDFLQGAKRRHDSGQSPSQILKWGKSGMPDMMPMQSFGTSPIANGYEPQMQMREEPQAKQKDFSDKKNFSEAFKEARKVLGPGDVFTWKGKKYTTSYSSEVGKKKATASPMSNTKDMMDVNQYAYGGRRKLWAGDYMDEPPSEEPRYTKEWLDSQYMKSLIDINSYNAGLKALERQRNSHPFPYNPNKDIVNINTGKVTLPYSQSTSGNVLPTVNITPQTSRVGVGNRTTGNMDYKETEMPANMDLNNPNGQIGKMGPPTYEDWLNNPNGRFDAMNTSQIGKMGPPTYEDWLNENPSPAAKSGAPPPPPPYEPKGGNAGNFMSQYGYMIPGALASTIGDIYDIRRGMKGPDAVNFPRVDAKYVNYEPARLEALRQANTATEQNRGMLRNAGLSKGQMVGNTLAGNAQIREGTAKNIGDIYMQQGRDNAGIYNQMQGMNAQIGMNEQIARQQETDMARSAVSKGLHGIGSKAQGMSRDMIDSWNQGRIMENYMKTSNFGYDKNGNKTITNVDLETGEMGTWTEAEFDKKLVEWKEKGLLKDPIKSKTTTTNKITNTIE